LNPKLVFGRIGGGIDSFSSAFARLESEDAPLDVVFGISRIKERTPGVTEDAGFALSLTSNRLDERANFEGEKDTGFMPVFGSGELITPGAGFAIFPEANVVGGFIFEGEDNCIGDPGASDSGGAEVITGWPVASKSELRLDSLLRADVELEAEWVDGGLSIDFTWGG
jgi:hypothetical protein